MSDQWLWNRQGVGPAILQCPNNREEWSSITYSARRTPHGGLYYTGDVICDLLAEYLDERRATLNGLPVPGSAPRISHGNKTVSTFFIVLSKSADECLYIGPARPLHGKVPGKAQGQLVTSAGLPVGSQDVCENPNRLVGERPSFWLPFFGCLLFLASNR